MSLSNYKLMRGGVCFLMLHACVVLASSYPDEVESALMKKEVVKIMRAMSNQTAPDTLNLPSNATSIRENITDNFSCQNRSYGYYADVDNECQVFHVCQPSKSASGRNATYRWSFICPEETVFNQEVLVCTRPEDSINCTDSPNYYDQNMEIGKIPEDEEETSDIEKEDSNSDKINPDTDKRKANVKKKLDKKQKKNKNKETQEKRPKARSIKVEIKPAVDLTDITTDDMEFPELFQRKLEISHETTKHIKDSETIMSEDKKQHKIKRKGNKRESKIIKFIDGRNLKIKHNMRGSVKYKT